MFAFTRVPLAFFTRDMQIEASYKLSFLMRFVVIIANVTIYYYLAKVFEGAAAPFLQEYQGNYFAFLVIGVAVNEYLNLGINSISKSIRDGQATGTLELMVLSPTRLPTILLSSTFWNYVFSTISISLYLLVAMLHGLELHNMNIAFALLALAISALAFLGLGLMAASIIIVMKRGDPLGWLIRIGSMVLGGVFYPTSVLPNWLQAISNFFPLTHALTMLRGALLNGQGWAELYPAMLIQLGLLALYLPCGLMLCAIAIRIARSDGSLSHY